MISLNTFIIADTHFGHENIGKFEPVRLREAAAAGYRDQDRFLIDQWNAAIRPTDTVLHLGDFCLKNPPSGYLKKLNGRKILMPGNHDKGSSAFHRSQGWTEVIDGVRLQLNDPLASSALEQRIASAVPAHLLAQNLVNFLIAEIGGERIMLSHFPVFDDNPFDKKFEPVTDVLAEIFLLADCTRNIHGHVHAKNAKEPFCINVSVERTGFRPVRLETLL